MCAEILSNYVNGKWIEASSGKFVEVRNPASGELLAKTHMSSKKDVEFAIKSAKDSFLDWRKVPVAERVRYLMKLKNLMDLHFEDIVETITKEHGKTLIESQGSVKRAIENIEHAIGIPNMIMGEVLEDVARGIDCESIRQPVGVFSAITPYNFPAMVSFWFWPYALACGNTFIVKPSEKVPLSQKIIFDLIDKAGFPNGVINLVNGDRETADFIINNSDVAGVSFVGSSVAAESVYFSSAKSGKRVQALGGAKNYSVVMPDAEIDRAVHSVAESAFGCAGQRCLATSVCIFVGEGYEDFREKVVKFSKSLKVGNGLSESVDIGPMLSKEHKRKVEKYIESGINEGANLLLDGRDFKAIDCLPDCVLGPTIFDNIQDNMTILSDEIFGPVLLLIKTKTLDEAIIKINKCRYGNASSIFTSSGGCAREFRYRIKANMLGVNVGVPAPMALFSFGGSGASFFGDLRAHGRDSIRFFTDAKVVISRWH